MSKALCSIEKYVPVGFSPSLALGASRERGEQVLFPKEQSTFLHWNRAGQYFIYADLIRNKEAKGKAHPPAILPLLLKLRGTDLCLSSTRIHGFAVIHSL